MSAIKNRTSLTIEAGTSALASQALPQLLTDALEYTSKRLARKGLHIPLIVVRRDHQLPSAVPTSRSASSCSSSPASPEFAPEASRLTSPVTGAGFRSLVRSSTDYSIASEGSTCSASTTPTSSQGSGGSASLSPPPSWPLAPESPQPRTPLTPATPGSVATNSTVTSTSSTASAGGPSPFEIQLIYASRLSAKEEKTLRDTIERAERKFHIGTGWLPHATTASACGLNAELVRRSMRQNEVVFSSEGLTLLVLDRLYTFKAALAAYARTTLPLSSLSSPISDSTRIEDAVDELRRLVLSNGGRPIAKEDLHSSYKWIGVSASALGDVESMYIRAYGGPERRGAFEDTESPRMELPVVKIGNPPPKRLSNRPPMLKLETTVDRSRGVAVRSEATKSQDDVPRSDVMELEIKLDDGLALHPLDLMSEYTYRDGDDDDRAARPVSWQEFQLNALGNSMDQLLLVPEGVRSSIVGRKASRALPRSSMMLAPSRLGTPTPQRMGTPTPSGCADISPVAKREWDHLVGGDAWKRTAAVETC